MFALGKVSLQDNSAVPRLSIDMNYDIANVDYAYAVFIDFDNLVRETFIEGVPQQTGFSATIVMFYSNVDVPERKVTIRV